VEVIMVKRGRKPGFKHSEETRGKMRRATKTKTLCGIKCTKSQFHKLRFKAFFLRITISEMFLKGSEKL